MGLAYSFGGLVPYHHGGKTWQQIAGTGIEYLRTLCSYFQAEGRKRKRHTQRYRERQEEGHARRETKRKRQK